MPYEVFARKVVRTGSPAISINTMARIGVNRSATEILRKNGVEYVLLLWDKEELKIIRRRHVGVREDEANEDRRRT